MPAFDPSPIELLFWNALALIAAACLFVPIFRRLGLGLALSSTALVMQTLDERRQRSSLYGRKSFSIRLRQAEVEGGLQSGLEPLHVAPVRPEPLSNLD